MWTKILEYAQALIFLQREVQQNKSDIKECEQELKKQSDQIDKMRSEFNDLVRVFDYVWYGEINISQQNYNVYKHKFERFKLE